MEFAHHFHIKLWRGHLIEEIQQFIQISLQILEDLGCLTRQYIRPAKVSLFSKPFQSTIGMFIQQLMLIISIFPENGKKNRNNCISHITAEHAVNMQPMECHIIIV